MAADNSKTNLIINYLPQSLTDERFHGMFTAFGPLKSFKVCRDKSTNVSYGFGFVDYHNPKHAEVAIQTLNGTQVDSKRIKVALSKPGGSEVPALYVSNLPKQFSESDVECIFQDCGKIISVRLLQDSAGESKGVGFVLFNKKYEADKAIDIIDDKIPQGGTDPIRVKFKREKEPTQNMPSVMSMPLLSAPPLSMQKHQKQPHKKQPQSLLTMPTTGLQQRAMMNNNFGGNKNNNYGSKMSTGNNFGGMANKNFNPMNNNFGSKMSTGNNSGRMANKNFNPMNNNFGSKMSTGNNSGGMANKNFNPMNPNFGSKMSTGNNFGEMVNQNFNPMNNNFGNQMSNNFGGPMRNDMSSRFRYNPMAAGNTFNQHASSNYSDTMMEQDCPMDRSSLMDQTPGDHCLFVHNVGYDCKKSELYRLFAPFGALQKVDVVMDNEKDQCKGFAFVHFVNYSDAAGAIECLNGYSHKGKQLQVRFKK